MPRDSRNTSIAIPANGNGIHAFPRFGMKDFKAIPAAARFIAGTAEKPAVKAPAHAAHGPTIITRHSASTDPIGGVPKGDERVASTDGEIAACRSEGDGETGRGVCVEGVEDVEGWVGHDLDCAFAGRCEEVEVRGCRSGDVMGEGGCVCLDRLRVGVEGSVGCSAFA